VKIDVYVLKLSNIVYIVIRCWPILPKPFALVLFR